jgi:hypothetical protein
MAGADISNGDAQNTSRSWSQDQRLLEMPKVGPGHDAGARTRRAYFASPASMLGSNEQISGVNEQIPRPAQCD